MFNILISLGFLECWWETGKQQINVTPFYNLQTKLDFPHTKIRTAWGLRLYKCSTVCRNETYHLFSVFAISFQLWVSQKALLSARIASEYMSWNSSISALWNEVFEIPYYYCNGKIAIANEVVSLEVQKMATEYDNWIIIFFGKSKVMFTNSTKKTGSAVKSLSRIFLFFLTRFFMIPYTVLCSLIHS